MILDHLPAPHIELIVRESQNISPHGRGIFSLKGHFTIDVFVNNADIVLPSIPGFKPNATPLYRL